MSVELFKNYLGWNIPESQVQLAIAIVAFWATALILTIVGLAYSNNADDAEKQKTFNFVTCINIFCLILTIYLAIRVLSHKY